MKSWINVTANNDFPIQNLPYGIFSTSNLTPRVGVAIGDFVLDLFVLHLAGLFSGLAFDSSVFGHQTLNDFMSLERANWTAVRQRLINLLIDDNGDSTLKNNANLRSLALIPMSEVSLHMPANIGDYTDFYSSREHATNVGIMFRGKDNALQPNWLHLPVGYHGRSSSVVISGTDVVRPSGQVQTDRNDPSKGSIFSPCRLLDFELEMAFFVGGKTNQIGTPLTISEADDRIFGVVLMNDWSARDIQAWEYVPLGPFTAKNFCTSISPWVVTLDALESLRCASSAGDIQSDPQPLPYLQDPNYATGSYDIKLEVQIQPAGDTASSVVSTSNSKYLYWNFRQQLVHHSVTGCPMRSGDLLGTGTISGPSDDSFGSMLELSWRGAKDVPLANSNTTRKFLQDGDNVAISGYGQGRGYRIGFGSVTGRVLPTGSKPATIPAAVSSLPAYHSFRLYSYWRSSCSWRVRLALALKQIPYEYVPINLLPLVGNNTVKLPSSYIEVNSLAQLPTIQFQSSSSTEEWSTLTQSLPIIEFLDELFPTSHPLLPSDPLLKAHVRQFAEVINSGMQPLNNINILRKVKVAEIDNNGNNDIIDGTGFAKHSTENGLATLEQLVKKHHNNNPSANLFAVGTSYPTLADICLVPQLYSAKRLNIDLTKYPYLTAVSSLCQNLTAFQKAVPEAQPDCPNA